MNGPRPRFLSMPGLGAALAIAALLTIPARDVHAGDKGKAVVELFTSQGCSSCPPADELLGKLAKRSDVIALTLPVDYWDYLGWKDTLANPDNSARQRAYAKARKDGQVYTPQMVIDGRFHTVGSRPSEVNQVIAVSKAAKRAQVPLKVWTEGNSLIITVGKAPTDMAVNPATIWLALVKDKATVKIERGENRGKCGWWESIWYSWRNQPKDCSKTLTYHKVVRDLRPVGQWSGVPVIIKLPIHHLKNRGADSCTVLLQQDTAGPVIAAAEMMKW